MLMVLFRFFVDYKTSAYQRNFLLVVK